MERADFLMARGRLAGGEHPEDVGNAIERWAEHRGLDRALSARMAATAVREALADRDGFAGRSPEEVA